MVLLLVLVVLFASVESIPLVHDELVEFVALCPPNDNDIEMIKHDDIQTMKHDDIEMMKSKKNDQQPRNIKLKDNVDDVINFEDATLIKKPIESSEISKKQSDAFGNFGETFKNAKPSKQIPVSEKKGRVYGSSCIRKMVCRRMRGMRKKMCFPRLVCTSSG